MKTLLLLCFMCIGYVSSYAQNEIQFTIVKTSQGNLSQEVANALDLKMKQILSRNSAASANQYNVFAVEPVIEIGEQLNSEGLMAQVALVKGELTLIAKNLVDGSIYHSIVIPVMGNSESGMEKATKSMVASIKSTDPQFTRFVRIARQKIQDYYANNCATILQKAKGLYDLKKYQEALSYLSAISETLPCYEQASVLQAELMQYIPDAPADTVIIQRVVEKVVEKPVVVEKIIEKPVVIEKVVEKPVANANPKVNCEITFSTNRLQFNILKCYGSTAQQRITILAEMTNVDTNRNSEDYLHFISAFTDSGTECKNFEIQNGNWLRMPPRVPVRREFYVTKIFDKFPSFSYIELTIADTRVYIRNLPIQWQ